MATANGTKGGGEPAFTACRIRGAGLVRLGCPRHHKPSHLFLLAQRVDSAQRRSAPAYFLVPATPAALQFSSPLVPVDVVLRTPRAGAEPVDVNDFFCRACGGGIVPVGALPALAHLVCWSGVPDQTTPGGSEGQLGERAVMGALRHTLYLDTPEDAWVAVHLADDGAAHSDAVLTTQHTPTWAGAHCVAVAAATAAELHDHVRRLCAHLDPATLSFDAHDDCEADARPAKRARTVRAGPPGATLDALPTVTLTVTYVGWQYPRTLVVPPRHGGLRPTVSWALLRAELAARARRAAPPAARRHAPGPTDLRGWLDVLVAGAAPYLCARHALLAGALGTRVGDGEARHPRANVPRTTADRVVRALRSLDLELGYTRTLDWPRGSAPSLTTTPHNVQGVGATAVSSALMLALAHFNVLLRGVDHGAFSPLDANNTGAIRAVADRAFEAFNTAHHAKFDALPPHRGAAASQRGRPSSVLRPLLAGDTSVDGTLRQRIARQVSWLHAPLAAYLDWQIARVRACGFGSSASDHDESSIASAAHPSGSSDEDTRPSTDSTDDAPSPGGHAAAGRAASHTDSAGICARVARLEKDGLPADLIDAESGLWCEGAALWRRHATVIGSVLANVALRSMLIGASAYAGLGRSTSLPVTGADFRLFLSLLDPVVEDAPTRRVLTDAYDVFFWRLLTAAYPGLTAASLAPDGGTWQVPLNPDGMPPDLVPAQRTLEARTAAAAPHLSSLPLGGYGVQQSHRTLAGVHSAETTQQQEGEQSTKMALLATALALEDDIETAKLAAQAALDALAHTSSRSGAVAIVMPSCGGVSDATAYRAREALLMLALDALDGAAAQRTPMLTLRVLVRPLRELAAVRNTSRQVPTSTKPSHTATLSTAADASVVIVDRAHLLCSSDLSAIYQWAVRGATVLASSTSARHIVYCSAGCGTLTPGSGLALTPLSTPRVSTRSPLEDDTRRLLAHLFDTRWQPPALLMLAPAEESLAPAQVADWVFEHVGRAGWPHAAATSASPRLVVRLTRASTIERRLRETALKAVGTHAPTHAGDGSGTTVRIEELRTLVSMRDTLGAASIEADSTAKVSRVSAQLPILMVVLDGPGALMDDREEQWTRDDWFALLAYAWPPLVIVRRVPALREVVAPPARAPEAHARITLGQRIASATLAQRHYYQEPASPVAPAAADRDPMCVEILAPS